MSSRHLPQKCTSLEFDTFLLSRPNPVPRLDLGCGEDCLISFLALRVFIIIVGSGYWILECAKLWRVSCHIAQRHRSKKLTHHMMALLQNCEFVGKRTMRHFQHLSLTLRRSRFGTPAPQFVSSLLFRPGLPDNMGASQLVSLHIPLTSAAYLVVIAVAAALRDFHFRMMNLTLCA
jgi:hypothetical protein